MSKLSIIFEQLFDTKSSTYTYIVSSGKGREALIIDPVIENTNEYIRILKNLDLKLVKVIDTHIHADHISGLNELAKQTSCSKIMGEQSTSEVIDIRVKDNEKIKIENSVRELVKVEEKFGIKKYQIYQEFAERVYKIRENIRKNISKIKNNNTKKIGYRPTESFPLYLSSYPIPIEREAHVIPDVMALQGKGTVFTVKEFLPNLDTIVIP